MPSKKNALSPEEQSARFIKYVEELTERGDFDIDRAQRVLDHVVKSSLADKAHEKTLDSKITDK